MKKPEKIPLAQIVLATAFASLLAYFAAIVSYVIYLSNRDLRTIFSPASSPAFNFMTQGFFVAFVLGALALVLAVITAIRESKRPKSTESPRNVSMTTTSMIIAAIMLYATMSSGVLPIPIIGKTASVTPSPKVTNILKDDVSVTLGSYDETSGFLPVTVTNKRPGATDYIIIIDALDRGGHRLAEDSIYTTDMQGRGTQQYKIFHASYTKASRTQMKSAIFKINDITIVDRTRTNETR